MYQSTPLQLPRRTYFRLSRILPKQQALDTESEKLVQSAIDRLIARGGCTVVLVAHRLSTVINADIIGVVHEGRVLEQGSHDELIKVDGVYKRLVAAQLAKRNNEISDDGDVEDAQEADGKGKDGGLDALFDEAIAQAAQQHGNGLLEQ